jgi:hypothetical protein
MVAITAGLRTEREVKEYLASAAGDERESTNVRAEAAASEAKVINLQQSRQDLQVRKDRRKSLRILTKRQAFEQREKSSKEYLASSAAGDECESTQHSSTSSSVRSKVFTSSTKTTRFSSSKRSKKRSKNADKTDSKKLKKLEKRSEQ